MSGVFSMPYRIVTNSACHAHCCWYCVQSMSNVFMCFVSIAAGNYSKLRNAASTASWLAGKHLQQIASLASNKTMLQALNVTNTMHATLAPVVDQVPGSWASQLVEVQHALDALYPQPNGEMLYLDVMGMLVETYATLPSPPSKVSNGQDMYCCNAL